MSNSVNQSQTQHGGSINEQVELLLVVNNIAFVGYLFVYIHTECY